MTQLHLSLQTDLNTTPLFFVFFLLTQLIPATAINKDESDVRSPLYSIKPFLSEKTFKRGSQLANGLQIVTEILQEGDAFGVKESPKKAVFPGPISTPAFPTKQADY